MPEKISSFTDLNAWKQAHQLVLQIYKLTKPFPQKEKIQFYTTSKASLTELQNQLLVARDVGYCNQPQFSDIAQQTIQVSKLITGLIRSAKSKP